MQCVAAASGQTSLFTSATPARPTPWRCLIKVSATVTVYRRHRRTLFSLPGIISLFITCVGIIRNNSLVEGGHARAKVWTQLLSASRATAHGARVLWQLGHVVKKTRHKNIAGMGHCTLVGDGLFKFFPAQLLLQSGLFRHYLSLRLAQ